MGSNIISEILAIDREINKNYRNSKYPKFINNFITKRRRSKLKKVIEKIKADDILPVELLEEYIYQVARNFSGKYKHCVSISPVENGEDLYIGTFKISVGKDTLYVIVAPETKDNSLCLIRYMYIDENGTTLFSFSEENINILKNNKSYDREKYPYRSHVINGVLKDLFCNIAIDDIYNYLMDTLKRSERIGK